jgi:hypothetical protein
VDTLERTVATFVEAFVGGLLAPGVIDAVADQPNISLSGVQSAALAAIVAALAVVKAAVAKLRGDPESASLVQ